jgi:hypothetical protein
LFPAFIVVVLIIITFISTSCDDYKSEEFEISALDSKACQQLQKADSLGVDTVTTVMLSEFDSVWVDSNLYDQGSGTYNFVGDILDSLVANDITVTNTASNKIKLITIASQDTNYVALQSGSSSLTFFFDRNISINIINQSGQITAISNKAMPLETASGCTELDENDVEVPYIKSRLEISVPDNPALLQLIKNEQTGSRTIHVSIL